MNKTIKLSLFLLITLAVFCQAGFACLPVGTALAQYYNYNNCNTHAFKLCVGNNIYWYDSCNNQQELFLSCVGTNMICQYGQCVYQQPAPTPVPNPYIAHYSIKCLGSSLYWYDSYGSVNTLYKSCIDANSCTLDTCASKKCSNTIECDGSTCAAGTPDYNTYCQSNNDNNNNNNAVSINGLAISFFVKTDPASNQWQKNAQVASNSSAYFMISVVNNSGSQIDNINVSASIPGQITSLGNLQLDGVAVAGDVVSGISIGSLTHGTTKSITFEGKTQSVSVQSTNQATANAKVNSEMRSDNISIAFNASQVSASVSSPTPYGVLDFLKRWYLWILVALVLIFLFVVVFRRLSSNA